MSKTFKRSIVVKTACHCWSLPSMGICGWWLALWCWFGVDIWNFPWGISTKPSLDMANIFLASFQNSILNMAVILGTLHISFKIHVWNSHSNPMAVLALRSDERTDGSMDRPVELRKCSSDRKWLMGWCETYAKSVFSVIPSGYALLQTANFTSCSHIVFDFLPSAI